MRREPASFQRYKGQRDKPPSEPPAGAGIKSVEKGAQILQALAKADGALRLIDIATRVGMPRSMAHGYLVSLLRTGLVARDGTTGLYDLGETALQLGLVALARVDFLKLARNALAELAEAVGETVVLSVWSEKGAIVVATIEGQRDSVYEVRIGSVMSLLGTATGRIFLAYLPREKWIPVLEAASADAGANLPADFEIEQMIEDIREAGVARGQVVSIPSFVAVSAPVFDHEGRVKAALTIVGRPEGMNVQELKRVSQELSRRLGLRG
jgi:DNA-binding IclR family transcriptional regulator